MLRRLKLSVPGILQFEPTALVVGRKNNQPTALVVERKNNQPTGLPVGARRQPRAKKRGCIDFKHPLSITIYLLIRNQHPAGEAVFATPHDDRMDPFGA